MRGNRSCHFGTFLELAQTTPPLRRYALGRGLSFPIPFVPPHQGNELTILNYLSRKGLGKFVSLPLGHPPPGTLLASDGRGRGVSPSGG